MEIELAEIWPYAIALIGFLAMVVVSFLAWLYKEDRQRIRNLERSKADQKDMDEYKRAHTDELRDLRKMIGSRLGRIEGHLMHLSK